MKKANPKKKETVKEFVKLIEEYPIVGALNMENLPTKQLQNIRAQLRDTVVIKMTKRRLMKLAIEQCKERKQGIEKLEEHLKGMPAMLFTKDNPFSLYVKLKKNKSSAPAKAGQTAPKDIIVPAGPTPFAPGPIIGELGQFRIKSGIEDGKVAVKEDTKVANAGDVISPQLAGILTRLGIEPMEIGLDLTAVYEDGQIYLRSVLDIDPEAYHADMARLGSEAFNLAMFIGFPTADTTKALISKAHNDAVALGMAQAIMADELIPRHLACAEMQAAGLKNQLNII